MECVYYGYAFKAIRELQEKNKNSVNSENQGKAIVSSANRKNNK